jgi:hypothetical protein
MITKANVLGFLLPKETKIWELSIGDLIDVTETLEVVVGSEDQDNKVYTIYILPPTSPMMMCMFSVQTVQYHINLPSPKSSSTSQSPTKTSHDSGVP